MKSIVCLLSAVLLMGAGCAHIASTKSTFSYTGETGAVLTLKVERHKEEILHAPDTDENQTLLLQLKDFKVGQRLAIPSAQATVKFDVDRFGPVSRGDEFAGYVIVQEVGEVTVKAYLKLTITARTNDGSYIQKEEFKGDYVFRPMRAAF